MCDDWKEREVVVVVLFWLVDDAEDGVSFVQYTMTKFEIGFSKKKTIFFFKIAGKPTQEKSSRAYLQFTIK